MREALLRLKSEGLVEIHPQRGTFVFTLSPQELSHLLQFRAMVETEALREAVLAFTTKPSAETLAETGRVSVTADGQPLSLFESGAILLYLAEKTGQFIPKDLRGRQEALQWLFWQMGGLGPMAGQNHHFNRFAPEKIPYAIKRYVDETARLYGVLNKRLADRPFVAGNDYSIADMAIYPWIVSHTWQQQNLDDFPALKGWFQRIQARPATQRAYALVEQINPPPA